MRITLIVLIAVMVLVAGGTAFAQTMIMPTFYNQSGSAVNTGSGTLAAGWYYTSAGNQVYYYGNGTYYDPSTQTYGGNVSNPKGTAGVVFNVVPYTGAPGVPNTGAGGNALMNWMLLVSAGVVLAGGLMYFSRRAIA